MADLSYKPVTQTVQNLIDLYEKGCLNLSPGFQRDSVWAERDRRKLIDSVVRGYPLPSIFLYRRESDGRIIYDVIDGKQRIESILMFANQIRGRRFGAKLQLPGENELLWVDWPLLTRRKLQPLITGYELQTIQVNGEPAEIIDLFVRINSTGKALTPAEKRHARYYNSEFLKVAGKLADLSENKLVANKILSAGQVARMRHVELICELMLSIHQGDVLNKKAVLDRIMSSQSLSHSQIEKARQRTVSAINRVFLLFPQIRTSRFRQMSDFYSLALLISRFEADNLVLTDRRRNQLAADLLIAFSNGVDSVRELQKKAKGTESGQELYREYLLTVQQATDEVSQRRKRESILKGLLETIFIRKDSERFFSQEQRRILWNTEADRICRSCGKELHWEDFTIDHIHPYSKGGRTQLDNAVLMCREHNSSKGTQE